MLPPSHLVSLYQADGLTQVAAVGLAAKDAQRVRLRGMAGNLDAVVAAAVCKGSRRNHVFILQDKEEAAYFFHNLRQLLPSTQVLFFPMSYRKPYEFEEVDNANVLLRAETLNEVSGGAHALVVTYPEALSERVIHQKHLVSHTCLVKKGETLDRQFLEEFLQSYHFEKADFVHEPGQFAVRGGIVDVFSFAHEYPHRIEFFGDEVDSIRSFNPGSQLSIEQLNQVSLMPDVQTRIIHAERQSFLDFLPANACVWCKDVELTLDVIQQCFEKVTQFITQQKTISDIHLHLPPEQLYETRATFAAGLEKHPLAEFGARQHTISPMVVCDFSSAAQPSFQKNFAMIAQHLLEKQQQHYQIFIAIDQARQSDRLHGIFQEIQPDLQVSYLNLSLGRGFIDHQLKILCYTDHEIFERYHRYQVKEKFSKSKALTLRELQLLQPGDFVTHMDYGIGKFAGLEKKQINGRDQENIRLIFKDDDILYINIHSLHKISKYAGRESHPPAITKLGSGDWENKKAKVRKKIKDIAKELIALYARRKQAPGFAFGADDFLQAELESSFLYEDTPDQAKATEDVKRDMMQPHPMDRLVCGDVGFGKTEVAIRAAFKAASQGKQVAVLVPTTILAFQHYRTFSERLASFPLKIEYISRFKTAKEVKEIINHVKEGKANIVIGTHRLVNQDIVFKNLGLLIIDEEQKFGVKIKEKLKEFRISVDVLTLTATPIPRTLNFSLMGARDLSIIATPPLNRQPVATTLHTYQEEIIRDAVIAELKRGGQVFFVHNRVSDIEAMANAIFRLVPDSRIGIAHGQMDGDKLERVMLKFIENEYDILVSTNIIESGLDIPNANTIIINNAHMFGLSDLHQMRGRVGRSNKKAYCYLLTSPAAKLSSEAQKRLSALEEFSDLGDGFRVAMRDLDIRGAGDLLGAEQSGFITDLGFEAYHKIIDEAIQELKESEFRSLFEDELAQQVKLLVADCSLETDLELLIPDQYIANITERLQAYAGLDNLKNEDELVKFQQNLQDRFGKYPESVAQLFHAVRLRWVGEGLGIEKISLKGNKLKAQFMRGKPAYFQSNAFGRILQFAQRNSTRCRIREIQKIPTLIVENIDSVEAALQLLQPLLAETLDISEKIK